MLLGETDRGMGHALLVAALVHPQRAAVLLQRLADAEYVAVAENGEDTGDELALHAIDFDVLVIEKLHQGLGHGQSRCAHGYFPDSRWAQARAPCRWRMLPRTAWRMSVSA